MADREIFRESAIQAYQRSTAKDIVPRLTSWPAITSLWVLLAALVAIAAVAWSVRVPTYASAQGVFLRGGAQAGPSGETTAAALFLPPDQSAHIRAGQPVALIGSSGPSVAGAVTKVEPGVIGPDTARTRYRFEPGADMVRQPWTVVMVQLRQPLSSATYGGRRLTSRMEIGSQRLLALFPGLGGAS